MYEELSFHIANDNYEEIARLVNIHGKSILTKSIGDLIGGRGNVDIVKFYCDNTEVPEFSSMLQKACANRKFEAAELLLERGAFPSTSSVRFMAEQGQASLVTKVFKKFPDQISRFDIQRMAAFGQVDMLRCTIEVLGQEPSVPEAQAAVIKAAEMGNLDILDYILGFMFNHFGVQGIGKFPAHMVTMMPLELLRYLIRDRGIKLESIPDHYLLQDPERTRCLCELGLVHGINFHQTTLCSIYRDEKQWVLEILREFDVKIDPSVVNTLVRDGFINAVKMLHEYGYHADFRAVQMLLEDQRALFHKVSGALGAGYTMCLDRLSYKMMRRRMELVKTEWFATWMKNEFTGPVLSRINLLIEQGVDVRSIEAATNAARFGHLPIVKLMYEQFQCRPEPEGVDDAAINGFFDVVIYASEVMGVHCTRKTIDLMCIIGDLEHIQFLHQKSGLVPTDEGLRRACIFGRAEVAAYFLENEPGIVWSGVF